MTSAYTFLPTKAAQLPKASGMRRRQARQYIFAVLLFLTIIAMSLYEFYFNIAERVENGSMESSVFQDIICEVFMLSVCPRKNSDIRDQIESINQAQYIQNSAGLRLTNQTVVIVVQVHNRITYLEQLIHSLSSVKSIDSTLLIFSHDHYSEEINKAVKKIDFAPFMQIFFPFSIQLFPKQFPGTSPKDCPWNMPVTEAKARGCQGAETPDGHGHYRQASVTQIKHHWWWKVHRVFEELDVMNNFNGYVLFLEEDHYLSPDSIHVLQLMADVIHFECPECNSIHIGNYNTPDKLKESANKVEVGPWNNLGFAFNRIMWNMLKSCTSVFCTFDDYNWDWSYRFTAQQCFYPELVPLVVQASRVFHIGDCGVHHKAKKECDSNISMKKAMETFEVMAPYLFPENLRMLKKNYNQEPVNKGWGGWTDPRDIQLCLNITGVISNEPAI